MRKVVPVLGVLMIIVGVVVAGLSLLTYSDKQERHLAEQRLEETLSTPERAIALDRLHSIEDRERLNISMAVGGSVLAAGGGAALVSLRRRRAAESRPLEAG